MLINDSVTVAVEVPVFLTKEDIAYYRTRGFDLDFESDVITGHIDFLQIRNGYIHILDYKPETRKETHAHVQHDRCTRTGPKNWTALEVFQVRLVR